MSGESEYLYFDEHATPSGKTVVVRIFSKRSNEILGTIVWHGPWRQYTFRPRPETIWNTACLDDVQAKIGELMNRRRKKKA